jgi:ectoine hydroxylase-related dioxygenase (phytanoyl-CoA dioxygenase family)
VTFPQPRVLWRLPVSGWHMDSSGRAGDPLLVVFACLSPVRSRGGGTLVVTGSHRLTRVGSRYAGLRSADVRVRLADNHPWFHYLLTRSDEPDRTERLLSSGSIVEEVEVRIEELTGDTGDTFIMDPRLLHAVAPNSRDTPRLMLLQFIQGRRSGDTGLPPRAMSDQTAVERAGPSPSSVTCANVVIRTTAEGVGFEPTRTEWAPP